MRLSWGTRQRCRTRSNLDDPVNLHDGSHEAVQLAQTLPNPWWSRYFAKRDQLGVCNRCSVCVWRRDAGGMWKRQQSSLGLPHLVIAIPSNPCPDHWWECCSFQLPQPHADQSKTIISDKGTGQRGHVKPGGLRGRRWWCRREQLLLSHGDFHLVRSNGLTSTAENRASCMNQSTGKDLCCSASCVFTKCVCPTGISEHPEQ